MSSNADDFGFRSFGDLTENRDEFGFISFNNAKPPKEPESLLGNIGRQAGRTGARVAETVLGAPRALGEFGESLIPEERVKKLAGKVGLREPVEKGFEFAKKYAPYKLFPESSDVREFNKFLFGKKIEPRNESEQKADNLVSDFAALALPFPGSKLKLLKPGLLAAGGNIASEIVGRMGGDEKEKTYAKLGTFLLGSLINPKSAEKLRNDLYSQARAKIPEGATVASKRLEDSVNHLEKALKKGGIAGSDKEALQKIADIRAEMQGAQIPVDSLERLKVKINESKAGIFKQLEGNKPGIKSAKRNLDMVGKSVDDALKDYGHQNPEWEAFYRPANEVHGAIEQSKRVRNYIGKIGKKYGYHIVLPLFGIGHLAGPGRTLGGIAASMAAGTALVGAGEISARIIKSPTLRKHYMNLVNSALKEDAIATELNLRKLSEELKGENQ
jgi:hypothetical protein